MNLVTEKSQNFENKKILDYCNSNQDQVKVISQRSLQPLSASFIKIPKVGYEDPNKIVEAERGQTPQSDVTMSPISP